MPKKGMTIQASPEEPNDNNIEDQSNLVDQHNENQEKTVQDLVSRNLVLQNELNSMKFSMNQMTKMLETIMANNIKSEEPKAKKSVAFQLDNSLMVETAKRLKETAPIEKDAPFLSSVTEIDWKKFVPLWKEYKSKNGSRSLFDLIKENPRIYYQDQIDDDMESMDCETLFTTINEINGTELDATGILEANLSMTKSDRYEKEKIKSYLTDFLVLLDRYPQIQDDLEEEAVIEIFFNHLQPTSLATFMKSLKCKSIKKATEALRNKMKRKDIASAEESKFTKSSNTTNNSDKTKKCINCENSKKADSNHSIWKCSNINYCYKCRSKHLAFGPECPHKDIKIFNYDSYLEKQNKKQDPSTVSTSTFKKKTQANLVNQNCPIVQQPTLTQIIFQEIWLWM